MPLYIGIIDIIDAKYPIDDYRPQYVDFSKGVNGKMNFICKENKKFSFSIDLNSITNPSKITCFDCKKIKTSDPIGLTFDMELIINDKKVAEGRIILQEEMFSISVPKYYPLFSIPHTECRDPQVKLSIRYEVPLYPKKQNAKGENVEEDAEEEEEEEEDKNEEEEETSEERIQRLKKPRGITLYGRYVGEEEDSEETKRKKERRRKRHEEAMEEVFKHIFSTIEKLKDIDSFYDNQYSLHTPLHSFTNESVMKQLEGTYTIESDNSDSDEPIMDDEIPYPYDSIVYQIKGDTHPYIFRVPSHFSSLNHNDCFIIQTKNKLWLWIGRDANQREIAKGRECFEKLFSYNPNIEKIVLTNSEITPDFWSALGGTKKDSIKSIPVNIGFDKTLERTFVRKLTEVETVNAFKKAEDYNEKSLSSNSLYVLHYGPSISIYIGKNAPKELVIHANDIAQNYLRQNSLPLWFPVSIIKEGTAGPQLEFLFS